jgi:hypothetical protein
MGLISLTSAVPYVASGRRPQIRMAALEALTGGFFGSTHGVYMALVVGVVGLFLAVAGLRFSKLIEIQRTGIKSDQSLLPFCLSCLTEGEIDAICAHRWMGAHLEGHHAVVP